MKNEFMKKSWTIDKLHAKLEGVKINAKNHPDVSIRKFLNNQILNIKDAIKSKKNCSGISTYWSRTLQKYVTIPGN